MTAELPEGLEKYAETPVFTAETVPGKLTSLHDIKAGTWGRLMVLTGALDYVVPGPPSSRRRITAGETGIIEPQVRHRVELVGPVTFQVEFHGVLIPSPFDHDP